MLLGDIWRRLNPTRFERVGHGIARRAQVLGAYWEPHFARSRREQADWAAHLPDAARLTVLGAGRLFDFDADALSARCSLITLVDADPSCLGRWQRLREDLAGRCEVKSVTRDVTGCLDTWVERFGEQVKRDWEHALELLRAMPSPPVEPVETCDALLSLNLLSQLPIMWQDAAEDILGRRFSRRFVEEREQEWLGAFQMSARALVRAHLAALAQSGARTILLLTDIEYAYYDDTPERGRREVHSALHDVAPLPLTGYSGELASTWEWHISPRGVEGAKRGTFHRVGAFRYTKTP